jgi:hypothetical protein
MQSASNPLPLATGVKEIPVRRDLKIRRPTLPVSRRISLMIAQSEVPGEQTVTLTQGLLTYDPAEHSEPFTLTVITLSIGVELTVRSVDPETPPLLAVVVAVPAASDAASPLEPVALLIVATAVSDELQVAEVVMFFTELLE